MKAQAPHSPIVTVHPLCQIQIRFDGHTTHGAFALP